MRQKLALSAEDKGGWYNFRSTFWLTGEEKRAQSEIETTLSFERIYEMSKFLDKLEA